MLKAPFSREADINRSGSFGLLLMKLSISNRYAGMPSLTVSTSLLLAMVSARFPAICEVMDDITLAQLASIRETRANSSHCAPCRVIRRVKVIRILPP